MTGLWKFLPKGFIKDWTLDEKILKMQIYGKVKSEETKHADKIIFNLREKDIFI